MYTLQIIVHLNINYQLNQTHRNQLHIQVRCLVHVLAPTKRGLGVFKLVQALPEQDKCRSRIRHDEYKREQVVLGRNQFQAGQALDKHVLLHRKIGNVIGPHLVQDARVARHLDPLGPRDLGIGGAWAEAHVGIGNVHVDD